MGWFDSYNINNYAEDSSNYFTGGQTVSSNPDHLCWNYILEVDNDCDDNLSQLPGIMRTLYLDIRDFNPFENEAYEEELENGKNETERAYYIQKRWMVFPIITNSYHFSGLSAYQAFNLFRLTRGEGGTPMEFDRFEITAGEKLSQDCFVANIRMRIKETAIEITDNCDSTYEGAPFEGCDDDSQGSGGGQEEECEDYSISGSESGTTLSVTTSNAPASGTETFRWRYRETESQAWSIISNDTDSYNYGENYGIYEVIGFKGGCQTEAYIFTIEDPCDGFEITLSQDANGYLIISSTRDATFEWSLDEGDGFEVIPGSGSVLLPEVSGDYQVRAEDGDCEKFSNIVTVTVTDCEFGVFIDINEDDTLTVDYDNYSGSDTPSFRWEKVTMGGTVAFGTDQTIEPDENALYNGYVELDGCEKMAQQVYINDCVQFKAYIESVIPGASNYTLNAATIGAPGAVDIKWYQWSGSQYVQIGSGTSVVTTQVGNVKMVATSGACTKTDQTEVAMDYNDPYYYQKFVLTGGEDSVEVTAFTLPDIVNLHPDRIAYLMEVIENGVEQTYDHETAPAYLERNEYSIDGQDVQFNSAYSRAGTVIVVKMKKI